MKDNLVKFKIELLAKLEVHPLCVYQITRSAERAQMRGWGLQQKEILSNIRSNQTHFYGFN